MSIRYKIQIVFLAIVILWASSTFAPTPSKTQYNANLDTLAVSNETILLDSKNAYLAHFLAFNSVSNFEFKKPLSINDFKRENEELINEEIIEEEILNDVIEEKTIVSDCPPIIIIAETEGEWKPYLATSYHGEVGNKGADLNDKKVVAMWQSDTNYLTYNGICEEYRDFYSTHNGPDFGALPYGTEVELRIWDSFSQSYKYLGIYKVLDDSPTTQYNLSEASKEMHCDNSTYYFDYTWSDIDYQGRRSCGGKKTGCITNWKSDYNYNIEGWIDVKDAGWGMVIVEMRIV